MIHIKTSKTADSRTAEGPVSKETLLASSKQHIADVRKAMTFFRDILAQRGDEHDWTKIDGIDDFYGLFRQGLTGDAFKEGAWFKRHVTEERHHLNDRCPDDVNLFDVLERVADICMAGMGRSGKVYDDTLSADILQRAYQNTVKMLCENITVDEEL